MTRITIHIPEKIIVALHALIHSLHIIKWSRDSNCHDSMPYSQIGPLDWKISQDQVFMVCMDCVGGEANYMWLIEINFDWLMIKIN